ncbi:hypothetical protein CDAR_227861 [Caerostris darwini]|uniref:Uncharacterized protein n=1 Tax=Caerostris darwini TaxID=1538125 RepID=A0AAV4PGY1_9ARAC|nr:hypothetical protein CDAR_227861 [Caerostris darwini]
MLWLYTNLPHSLASAAYLSTLHKILGNLLSVNGRKEVKQKHFERTSLGGGSTTVHSKSANAVLHHAVFTPRDWPHMTSFGQPGQAA